MTKSKKDSLQKYVLLSSLRTPSGAVLQAGETIELSPEQAVSLSGKVRLKGEPAPSGNAALDAANATIAELQAQATEREEKIAQLEADLAEASKNGKKQG